MINVTKRNGTTEALNLEKFHKVTAWACEDITGVSPSEIELKSRIQFYDGIKSSDIQETLIRSAADLITEETPNYQFVAGRLINYHLRKMVYGGYKPKHLWDQIHTMINMGYYDVYLGTQYSYQEIEELNDYIKHDRDFDIAYAGMEQFRGKYAVKHRATGTIFETPNMSFMCIAMVLFAKYPEETRLSWVKEYYDAISTFDLSLPTPIMAGVRTPQRQFSSCVLIETDDSLDSINATTSSIVKYVSQKAGIGIGAGRIRAINSPVRNGDTVHTGTIPFIKLFQAAVKSCSQGGVRGGAATLYYPIWHLEVEDLLVLKNNKGTEESRARHMDYGVQLNRVMYERLLQGKDITLFSPADVPEMYEAFYNDVDKFRTLYEEAESNLEIRRKTLSAMELFSKLMMERKDTGRIYIMNVDHCNEHGSFDSALHPVRMSNLCCEITLPTIPLRELNDEDGRIALCTLSAINWGKIKHVDDFERICRLAVRGLDALLTFQNYPVTAAKKAVSDFRPLGVGIINLAYWMAKNDIRYQDVTPEQLTKIHRMMEAMSYYLIQASVELAEEQQPCDLSRQTKYGQGVLPVDTYKKDVDALVSDSSLHMPWADLRDRLRSVGIRNATLMAFMPSETSSQISNATNGIEPPRALISVKQSKDGVLKQVVPEYRRLKNKYDLLWDQTSPEGYLRICAVLQKFVDQAISVNTSYNPKYYEEDKIPMTELMKHLLMHYKLGGKTLYYNNTHDGAGEVEFADLPSAAVDEDDCDSCKI